MNKKYTSFEELDVDIKRAWLQSEIDREELKLSLHETKDSLTPGKIATTLVGGMATSAVLLKLLTPLISFGIGKLLKKYK
ncbi:hypothetical protein G5B37_10045 [Rasiella rasia]|uniref:Uncharacterized protein n=1 Tax=Rasiella rasia TaxID=2744027 RepID=A0A6G6GNA5_9FLAO|nr:DUF6327 family protein [Rasiella rasia]QIE59893.1 hypothetical protein G5B37_10045 [Rasiella rasia]